MKLPLSILLLTVCSIEMSGCRKKPAAQAASAPPAAEVAVSLGIPTNALPDHKVLYEAISKFMAANQGRAAKDVNELVEKGFLKPLPSLPPGKRYHLDQRSAILTIVD